MWIANRVILRITGHNVDCKWNNCMHYWPQRLILENWMTIKSFLSWFSYLVPTRLGDFLLINLLFFFPPKQPCFLLTLHIQWLELQWFWPTIAWLPLVLINDGSTPNSSNSWWFDLWRLGPTALNKSMAGHPPMALSRKPRSTSLEAQF